MKTFVDGPQLTSFDCCGGEQVNIHIANATAVELSHADEVHDLFVFSNAYHAKFLKQFESCLAVREVTAGEFTDYERMHHDFAASETLAEFGLAFAKVVNPY
jgi:hypothetical protein